MLWVVRELSPAALSGFNSVVGVLVEQRHAGLCLGLPLAALGVTLSLLGVTLSLLSPAMSDCSASIQLLCDHGAAVNSKDGVRSCPALVLHRPCWSCRAPCAPSPCPQLSPLSPGRQDTVGAGHPDVSPCSLPAAHRQGGGCQCQGQTEQVRPCRDGWGSCWRVGKSCPLAEQLCSIWGRRSWRVVQEWICQFSTADEPGLFACSCLHPEHSQACSCQQGTCTWLVEGFVWPKQPLGSMCTASRGKSGALARSPESIGASKGP